MTPDRLRQILEQVAQGALDAPAAFELVKQLPFEDLGFAKVDHHRALRSGLPEVVLGTGKTAEQIIAIARRLHESGQPVLITRLTPEVAAVVTDAIPELQWVAHARLAHTPATTQSTTSRGTIVVTAAGTSDLPV